MKNDVGYYMRKVREEAGLSLSQLADLSGISERTIWNNETGRSIPNVATLMQLADALHISIDGYIGRDDSSLIVKCKDCDNVTKYIEPEHGKTMRYCRVLKREVGRYFFCGYGCPRNEHQDDSI